MLMVSRAFNGVNVHILKLLVISAEGIETMKRFKLLKEKGQNTFYKNEAF